MVKQIEIPGNIFSTTVINKAAVAGGGEVNTSNDSASDVTIVDPPRQAAGPGGNAAGVFNAGGYAPVVAAGSIASVFGNNLSIGQASAGTIPLPTILASSSFQIGGQTAPLFFASPSQVNLQIPWELAGQPQAIVTGTVGGATSMQQTVSMAPFAPGLFTLEAGSSQGVVMIADTQLLVASPSGAGRRPATAGEFITLYCTGLGAVSNQPATGMPAQSSPYSVTTTTPTVTIGGIPALVSFSRLAPGSVGLYQVNVQVPMGLLANDAVPVILLIGGVSSNAVTIAVQ
jgi:adhesin/invasin